MLLRGFNLLALLLLAVCASAGEHLVGKIVGIADGDSLTLLVDREQVKVRLAEIDTPERGQPFGTRAREALSALAFGRSADVLVVDTDRYGRTVGRVYVDGVDVNAELVREGYAWAYRRYLTDESLLALEQEAREARRGLWADADPTPPWEWRRGGRRTRASPPEAHAVPAEGAYSCAGKRYCGQMTSCAEAWFYFKQCALMRLDGDSDGVPCERLCR